MSPTVSSVAELQPAKERYHSARNDSYSSAAGTTTRALPMPPKVEPVLPSQSNAIEDFAQSITAQAIESLGDYLSPDKSSLKFTVGHRPSSSAASSDSAESTVSACSTKAQSPDASPVKKSQPRAPADAPVPLSKEALGLPSWLPAANKVPKTVQVAKKDAMQQMPLATPKSKSQSPATQRQNKDSAGGGLLKKLLTAVALLGLSILIVCIYAVHEPNSNLFGANGLLDGLQKVGKEIPDGLRWAAMGLDKTSSKVSPVRTPSDNTKLSMSQQGVVTILVTAVGGAVTSGIGYGCYWIFTQGD